MVYFHRKFLYFGQWYPNRLFSKLKGFEVGGYSLTLFICDCNGGVQLPFKEGSGWRFRLEKGFRFLICCLLMTPWYSTKSLKIR